MSTKKIKKPKKISNNIKPGILYYLNTSPILAGIMMIVLNIGSKYVEMGFSESQEMAVKSLITREILIFAMAYTATKNIPIALILTASFIVLSNGLFNDQSKFCIMPGYFKKLKQYMDTNNDNKISPQEEQRAINILRKAQKQKINK